ncbi:MAG: hypothetical protein ACFB50_12180 [Rubrobacteraceae bacterium]
MPGGRPPNTALEAVDYIKAVSGRLGQAGVAPTLKDESETMVGLQSLVVIRAPLDGAAGRRLPLDRGLYDLARVLAGLSKAALS